jgi:hypothetical protein
MKKRMLIGWVTIFILFAFGTSCFAANAANIANTTKKGSYLVFPLILAGTLQDVRDTIVTISNDGASAVRLQCYYKYPNSTSPPCLCKNFEFTLTAYQEISFSVKTGENYGGGAIPRIGTIAELFQQNQTGELKCFAVDNTAAKNPISFNFLSGEATIHEGPDMTWMYPAWRFAVGANIPAGAKSATKGQILLTGTLKTYDACPSQLVFPFIQNTQSYPGTFDTFNNVAGGSYQTVENRLTLVPCKQDCVSGGAGNDSITNAELLVYREDESGPSGAYACVGCNSVEFFSDSLRSTKLHDPAAFSHNGGPPGAIVLVRGRASYCPGGPNPFPDCNSTTALPMIGVMSHQFVSDTGPIAGEAATTVGLGQGWILDCHGGNTTIPVAFTYK